MSLYGIEFSHVNYHSSRDLITTTLWTKHMSTENVLSFSSTLPHLDR